MKSSIEGQKTKSPLSFLVTPGHKRVKTFDFQHVYIPQTNEYQLKQNFQRINLIKRKDSCPTKDYQFKERLNTPNDFSSKISMRASLEFSRNSSKEMTNLAKENPIKIKKLNNEFLKDLTRIYDSNFKTSKTHEEYQDFSNKKYQKLDRNIRSINASDQNSLNLSKEVFFSEEHREIMARTLRNHEKNQAEMLS